MNPKRHIARLLIAIIFSMELGSACIPRQIKPVATIDPAPLLQQIQARQTAFEKGLSGTLELSFKNGKRSFNSKAYIVAFPDGRFRLEIPGPFGDTYFVMVSDNREILAFYPDKNRAFKSAVNSKALTRHLPFPLPVDPAKITSLTMGVFPQGSGILAAKANLMDSGEKLLLAAAEDEDLRYTFLFDKTSESRVRMITIKGAEMEVSINTYREALNLPKDFKITFSDGFIKGEWESVALFSGDDSVFRLRLPDSTTVTDLGSSP